MIYDVEYKQPCRFLLVLSPLPPCHMDSLGAVEAYIMEHHSKTLSWHTTLNNHVTTRPQKLGGPLAPNVTSAKTFSQTKPGAASSEWKCELSLPNSFAPNDGLQIQVESVAELKDAASEKACCRAMALLLSSNPEQVVLRQSHWKIDVNDLVGGLPIECPGQQALPLPAPRAQQALPLPTWMLDANGHAEATALIKRCLYAHGGSFDPSRINNRTLNKAGIKAGEEKAHETLNRLLQRGTLRKFIEGHSEFRWDPNGRNGMVISWARPVLPVLDSESRSSSSPVLDSESQSGIATPNAADTEVADCPASVCSGSAKHACPSTVNLQDEDFEHLDGMD